MSVAADPVAGVREYGVLSMLMAQGTLTLPGPETLVLFGVHIKVLSLIFGVLGVTLGHLMAPTPAQPLGVKRQAAVFFAGLLVAIAVTIATGQRPLVVLGWCIGIGFSGIAIYQIWGATAATAAKTAGAAALDELAARIDAARKKK